MTTTNPDLAWAIRAFGSGKKAASYRKYENYLEGNHSLAFATGRFKAAFGSTFEAFSYNRCATVVDAHADRLQIAGWDCGGDKNLQAFVEQTWALNQMENQEGHVEREQFGMGDAHLIVEADVDSPDVFMWPQSAQAIRLRYSEERLGKVIMAAKRWRDDSGRPRLTLYFEDRIEKYAAARKGELVTAEGDFFTLGGGAYQPYSEDDEPWPIELKVKDTVPVFHFANNAPIGRYGISELRDVIPLQDALNKTILDGLVAAEFGAFRQRYTIDIANQVVDQVTGETITDPEFAKYQAGITRILNLFTDSGLENRAGQVGEFEATEITQYDTMAASFDRRISYVSRVPIHELQNTEAPESGIARRLKDAPFAKKMDDRVKAAKPVWAAAMRYAARLAGHDVKPGVIKPIFDPVSPLTEEEKMAIALDRQSLGYALEDNLKAMGVPEGDIALIVANAEAHNEAQAARSDRLFNGGIVPSLMGD